MKSQRFKWLSICTGVLMMASLGYTTTVRADSNGLTNNSQNDVSQLYQKQSTDSHVQYPLGLTL